MINISSYIDHTVLKPTTTHIDIKKICEEAVQYNFAAVCIPPSLVTLARKELQAVLKADPDAPVIELPDVPRSGGRRREDKCK